MIEYYTEGIVLDRNPRGDIDGSTTIYTKDLGKIIAFTKSIRKITSKLSGHLMPGNKVRLRIVENKSIQAIDALSEKSKCDMAKLLPFLHFIDEVVPQGEKDANFWYLINEIIEKCYFEPESYHYILGVLGYGVDDAVCENCKSHIIAHFSMTDIIFLCDDCMKTSHLAADEAVKIKG